MRMDGDPPGYLAATQEDVAALARTSIRVSMSPRGQPLGSVMEALAWGYGLVEAPRADDGSVYFSDVLGGGVHRWSPGGGVETVIPKRRGIGGMCLHADGGIVVSGRTLVHVRDGETRELSRSRARPGSTTSQPTRRPRLRRCASLHAVRRRGAGAGRDLARRRARERKRGARRDRAGRTGSASRPTAARCTHRIRHGRRDRVRARSGERHVLARTSSGDADGLAVDAEGGVWVALGSGGAIARYSPQGELEDTLDVPAGFVTSLCFGGVGRTGALRDDYGQQRGPVKAGHALPDASRQGRIAGRAGADLISAAARSPARSAPRVARIAGTPRRAPA